MIIDLIKKNIPEYTTTLPVSKQKVSFRPLLVKEEKYFSIITNISSTFEDKIKNICSLVNSCFDDKIKSSLLPISDFQFALNSIRQKSISETSTLKITCPYTKESVQINFDLNDLSMKTTKKDLTINLKSEMKLKFRSPRMKDLLIFEKFPESDSEIFHLVAQCLVEIETPSGIIETQELDYKEKSSYIELLERSTYKKVKEFICDSNISFMLKYKTSDSVDREIEVNDFVNFLKFYLVILTL